MADSEVDQKIVQSVIVPYLDELYSDLLLREISSSNERIGKLVFNEVS